MNPSGEKIVEQLRGAETVLVTVSRQPSVDELATALGLTMHLNEIGKHATAVVSSDIPSAITFLNPEKTFKDSVDSLRDFVISLDKEKADHLRYKLDGDMVKIFITPYKTVITEKDLEYSQGDYNVDTVIAIGVTDQADLDRALESHGKILHDATVATIGLEASKLGSLEWHDGGASSVAELVTHIVDALKPEDKTVSERVASALLTGIVAATERFSNDKTNATVMSAAAKLMSYGANQQLIASKLQPEPAKPAKVPEASAEKPAKPAPKKRDTATNLAISHDEAPSRASDEKAESTPDKSADKAESVADKPEKDTSAASEPALPSLPPVVESSTPKRDTKTTQDEGEATLAAELALPAPDVTALDFEPTPVASSPKKAPNYTPAETLADLDRQHRKVKSGADGASDKKPVDTQPSSEVATPKPPVVEPTAEPAASVPVAPESPIDAALPLVDGSSASTMPSVPPLPGVPVESVDQPTIPAPPLGLPPLPPQPDFGALPPLPPQPDFATLPPLPAAPAEDSLSPEQPLGEKLPPLPSQPVSQPAPAAPVDPGQFRIPGQ